jgi:hypothetical protein
MKRCDHPNLKTFTLANGETLQSCPDCRKFDRQRRALLKEVPEVQHVRTAVILALGAY